jgi:hypothetical protein
MLRQPCNSSRIQTIGYDAATQTLEVEFRPGKDGGRKLYSYTPVSQETANDVIFAPSIGSAFHHKIVCDKTLEATPLGVLFDEIAIPHPTIEVKCEAQFAPYVFDVDAHTTSDAAAAAVEAASE